MPRKFQAGTMPQRVRVPNTARDLPPPDVTIVLGSFLRFGHLWRVLMSCRREFPGVPVIVADCSLQEGQTPPPTMQRCRDLPGVTWLQLPFDAGVSACRNAAVEAVQTDLVFLTDDDHEFCWASNLHGLCEVLHESRADMAAGCVQTLGSVQSWSYLLEGEPPRHRTIPVRGSDDWQRTTGGHAWRKTGTFFNAFVVKRQTLLRAPWDAQFPIMEHRDHICTVHEQGLSVVYSPAMIVLHDRETPISDQFLSFRWRREEMDRRLTAKRSSVVSFGPALDEPIPTVLPINQTAQPNVIVFGVGHSGTTILTRLLAGLGWRLGDADAEYSESVSIREANQEWLAQKTDRRLPGCAAKRLAALPAPWVLKDPRFVHTLEPWLPLLAPYDPLLLFLTRDAEKLRASYERRGECSDFREGLSINESITLSETQYDRWPWRKYRIDAAQVEAVMALWQPGRI